MTVSVNVANLKNQNASLSFEKRQGSLVVGWLVDSHSAKAEHTDCVCAIYVRCNTVIKCLEQGRLGLLSVASN